MTTPGPAQARWDWLLLALMTATLASLARWAISSPAIARTRVGPALAAATQSPWLVQPLRAMHALGIPAAALYWQHALSAKALGLKPLPYPFAVSAAGLQAQADWDSWARDIGQAALYTAVIAAVVIVGDRRARHVGKAPVVSSGNRSWLVALREGIIHQVRWAFYREPFVFVWGPAIGSWLGTLPVLAEALVSPVLWRGLRTSEPNRSRAIVVRAGLLVGSTITYLATQNLWMTILLNVLLEWALLAQTHPEPVASA